MLLSNPFKDLYTSADPADSVLTFNSLALPTLMDSSIHRKRSRVDTSSLLNTDTISTLDLLHQHEALDVDRLVSHHMERMRLELWAKWREFIRRAAANVAEDAARTLKVKEEEVEQARRLNAALEEHVHTLSVEAQIWRDLAENNEAAAHLLRRELQSVLSCHRQLPKGNDSDAESCCDNYESENKAESRKKKRAVVCRGCEEEEPSVLVLPCRHLCFCPACASRAPACLVCGCTKQCTVHVNLS